jgi:hypothetical protein
MTRRIPFILLSNRHSISEEPFREGINPSPTIVGNLCNYPYLSAYGVYPRPQICVNTSMGFECQAFNE